jgi:hypothetical protein
VPIRPTRSEHDTVNEKSSVVVAVLVPELRVNAVLEPAQVTVLTPLGLPEAAVYEALPGVMV